MLQIFCAFCAQMFTRLRISASSSQRTLRLPSVSRCPRRTFFQSFVARQDEFIEADEEDDAFGEAIFEGLDLPNDAETPQAPSYEDWIAGAGLKYRDPAPRNWLGSRTVCPGWYHSDDHAHYLSAFPS
jgi:hypothetical protein